MTQQDIDALKNLDYLHKSFPNGAYIKEFNCPGAIKIDNIEKVEIDTLIPGKTNLYDAILNAVKSKKKEKEYHDLSKEEQKIVLSVAVVFNRPESLALQYLRDIKDRTDIEVAGITRKYREERKVAYDFNHHDLWTILYENGYYKSKIRNWNSQLSKKI